MEVSIGFNPTELKPEDECYPAFRVGGLALIFWALYKKNHITSQYFRPSLEKLIEHFDKMFDDDSEVVPYQNIDEFYWLLRDVGISFDRHWLVKHWDYFNLNVRKKVTLKYKAMVETDVLMPIDWR